MQHWILETEGATWPVVNLPIPRAYRHIVSSNAQHQLVWFAADGALGERDELPSVWLADSSCASDMADANVVALIGGTCAAAHCRYSCLALYRVERRLTLSAVDGGRRIEFFRAPDAESVRYALRYQGIEPASIWPFELVR